jgi:hypothetical protein
VIWIICFVLRRKAGVYPFGTGAEDVVDTCRDAAATGSEAADQDINRRAEKGQEKDRHNDRRSLLETSFRVIAVNEEELGKGTHGIVSIEGAIPCRVLLIVKIGKGKA